METKHTHQFAVDAACDCGAMISEVVHKLTSDNAALIAVLEAICRDAQAKIDAGDNQIGVRISTEYWNRACAVLAKVQSMG